MRQKIERIQNLSKQLQAQASDIESMIWTLKDISPSRSTSTTSSYKGNGTESSSDLDMLQFFIRECHFPKNVAHPLADRCAQRNIQTLIQLHSHCQQYNHTGSGLKLSRAQYMCLKKAIGLCKIVVAHDKRCALESRRQTAKEKKVELRRMYDLAQTHQASAEKKASGGSCRISDCDNMHLVYFFLTRCRFPTKRAAEKLANECFSHRLWTVDCLVNHFLTYGFSSVKNGLKYESDEGLLLRKSFMGIVI